MRVLWFSTNSAKYKYPQVAQKGYNGGGWMSSLQNEFSNRKDIELGICFCGNGQPEKVEQEGVVYYPVPHHQKYVKDKFLDLIYYKDVKRDEILWPYYINRFKKVIHDFKPDVIEVFGSELYVGLSAIAAKGFPVVLHLQGLLSLSIYIFLPPGVSYWQYIWKDRSFKKAYANFQELVYWRRSCHREKEILKAVSHVIGRTEWDKAAMQLLAPQAQYHHGGEILRPVFYEATERTIPIRTTIMTIISQPLYKGFDLILKIANILKNELGMEFDWDVYGNVSPKFWEKHTRIRHNEVNVNLRGVASARKLRDALLNTTLYVHPSYIENSPNSVAEAQILGIPVVATNVGGTPSMVEHKKTGLLFPATDPYMGAYYIQGLSLNIELNVQIGNIAKKQAIVRHDKDKIVKKLLGTYQIGIDRDNN